MKAICHEIYFLSGHELQVRFQLLYGVDFSLCEMWWLLEIWFKYGGAARVRICRCDRGQTHIHLSCLSSVKKKANFVTAALPKTRDQSDESMSVSTLVYTLRTGSGLSEQTSICLNLEKCQAPRVSGWNNFYYLFVKRNVPCKLRHEQHNKSEKRANSGRGFLSKSGLNWRM